MFYRRHSAVSANALFNLYASADASKIVGNWKRVSSLLFLRCDLQAKPPEEDGVVSYHQRMFATELRPLFGEIDIYLFDQLLRGRVPPGLRILDTGCGNGRNLVYFLRQGYEVYGVDRDQDSIEQVRRLAATLAPGASPSNFRAETIESMSFPHEFADLVISSAVLHFARDDDQFRDMLNGTWRVLKLGGLLFCRLASSIGLEHQIHQLAGRRFLLPDGSERYLVDEALLAQAAIDLGGRMIDPLKTTMVQNERSMTTWVLRKEE